MYASPAVVVASYDSIAIMITLLLLFLTFLGVPIQSTAAIHPRPPFQTELQKKILFQSIIDSGNNSMKVVNRVLHELENTIISGGLKGLLCEHASAEELLSILQWEYQNAPLIHQGTGPNELTSSGNILDGPFRATSSVFINLGNGYIQSTFHRYIFGETKEGPLRQEHVYETFINFNNSIGSKKATLKSLQDANDRHLYLSLNILRNAGGIARFGPITYVLKRKFSQIAVICSVDLTVHWQKFCPGNKRICAKKEQYAMGTINNSMHVMLQNMHTYKYTFEQLFHRLYGRGEVIPQDLFPIFPEVLLMGNFLLPEMLSYFTLRFSDLWGNVHGSHLRTWAKLHGRPIVWASDDPSKSLLILDPIFDSFEQPVITADMIDKFNQFWEMSNLSFTVLYQSVPFALRFNLPSYYGSRIHCESVLVDPEIEIMGSNADDKCVYWAAKQPPVVLPRWECLNDGTCVQSDRGTYDSMESCNSRCGGGSWDCIRRKGHTHMGSYCIPHGGGGEDTTAIISHSNLQKETTQPSQNRLLIHTALNLGLHNKMTGNMTPLFHKRNTNINSWVDGNYRNMTSCLDVCSVL